ncbi:MAG TPA: trypsin-like serine protease [Acidimicrobiia bacterium]|nr:trypsin-like serine protease [Acidimicrobiia bacterium]
MRTLRSVLVAIALVLATALPAGAVVGGELDGELHSNVGMFFFTESGSRFRCSGTLVAPTIVLTAAHCTLGSTDVRVTFDSVAQQDPLRATSPGDASRFIVGTAHAHPDWNQKLQLKDLLDIGVVVLDAPASTIWPGITPAPLPTAGLLDDLAAKGGLKKVPFEVVGYGVFFEQPDTTPRTPTSVRDLTRRYTTAPLQNINGETVKLQESAGDAKFGGGTCFGDSGGALFLDGVLVGDTSWGGSQYCSGGAGGYQRTDTSAARAFLSEFVTVP